MGWTVLEPFETAVNCIAATALLERRRGLRAGNCRTRVAETKRTIVTPSASQYPLTTAPVPAKYPVVHVRAGPNLLRSSANRRCRPVARPDARSVRAAAPFSQRRSMRPRVSPLDQKWPERISLLTTFGGCSPR